MKWIFILISFSCCLAIGQKNNSDILVAEAKAAQIALRLRRVQKPEQLKMVFLLDHKTFEMVNKKVFANPHEQRPMPELTMPTATTLKLVFKDSRQDLHAIIIDFGFWQQNKVFVNKKLIQLESYKTFLNYRNEVSDILTSTKVTGRFTPFVNFAEAADLLKGLKSWMTDYTSAVVKMSVHPKDLQNIKKDDNLAAEIIHAYEEELSFHKKYSEQGVRGSMAYSPITFECQNGHLTEMYESYFETDGKSKEFRKEGHYNKFVKTENGYRYSSDLGQVEMDSNFKVTASDRPLIEVNSDLSVQGPFFKFPEVADKCCAANGCYEKVKQAFESSLEKAVQTFKPKSVK